MMLTKEKEKQALHAFLSKHWLFLNFSAFLAQSAEKIDHFSSRYWINIFWLVSSWFLYFWYKGNKSVLLHILVLKKITMFEPITVIFPFRITKLYPYFNGNIADFTWNQFTKWVFFFNYICMGKTPQSNFLGSILDEWYLYELILYSTNKWILQ